MPPSAGATTPVVDAEASAVEAASVPVVPHVRVSSPTAPSFRKVPKWCPPVLAVDFAVEDGPFSPADVPSTARPDVQ